MLAQAAKGVPQLAQSLETKIYIQDLPASVTDEKVGNDLSLSLYAD